MLTFAVIGHAVFTPVDGVPTIYIFEFAGEPNEHSVAVYFSLDAAQLFWKYAVDGVAYKVNGVVEDVYVYPRLGYSALV